MGRPLLDTRQVDVVAQDGTGAGLAVVDRLRKPEQFRRTVDPVGILLGADAAGCGQGLGSAQHHGHGESCRLFSQSVPLGQFGRKGVLAAGGRLREALAGPGQGQPPPNRRCRPPWR